MEKTINNCIQDGLFGLNRNFMGFNIVEHTPRILPKIKLSDGVPCTDDFRDEFNAWLLDMFGTIEYSLIHPGMAYMFGHNVVMRPEMCAMLRNSCA